MFSPEIEGPLGDQQLFMHSRKESECREALADALMKEKDFLLDRWSELLCSNHDICDFPRVSDFVSFRCLMKSIKYHQIKSTCTQETGYS